MAREGLSATSASFGSEVPMSPLDRHREAGPRHEIRAKPGRSSEDYSLLFDGNPLPMWAFDPETLAFLDVNEAAVRHYGYSREEFLSMTILDIRPPRT